MTSNAASDFLLHIETATDIDAPLPAAFAAMLEQLGPAMDLPNGAAMPMKLEPWPGGRWFRDLGDNTGHLWGHVQVIKPPTLLEIHGPLMMSYAAVSHVQYRLAEQGARTRLTLTHRAFGPIAQEHRDGVAEGWQYILQQIKARARRAR